MKDGSEKFSDGRIEHYDTAGTLVCYEMLKSEDEPGDKLVFNYNECNCISTITKNSSLTGKKEIITWYDYDDSHNVKEYFRGNLKSNQYTQSFQNKYNDDFQLIQVISEWNNDYAPSTETTYNYLEEDILSSTIRVDLTKENFEEFPDDSTFTEYQNGNKIESRTYKEGILSFITKYDYAQKDTLGNWTEMYHSMKWTDMDVYYSVRREIDYYK